MKHPPRICIRQRLQFVHDLLALKFRYVAGQTAVVCWFSVMKSPARICIRKRLQFVHDLLALNFPTDMSLARLHWYLGSVP